MNKSNYGLVLEGERIVVTRAPRATFFDPRYLVAALLEYVALGDGQVCELESAKMVDLVAAHFGLPEAQAEKRLVQALNLYARSLDLATVAEVLREILDSRERHELLLMLLEVIAADGRQGADELEALDVVATLLEISDEERHAAFDAYFSRDASPTGRRIHLWRKSTL